LGRSKIQEVSGQLLSALAGFDPRTGLVGFVVDKVALGQVYPPVGCFGFPHANYKISPMFYDHVSPSSSSSSEAGKIGSFDAAVPVDTVSPIAVFRELFSPAAHPNLLKTHDGTPQYFASRKGGTKLFMTINMYLHINPCPIRMQAYENKT
jgi:hypothetical protein